MKIERFFGIIIPRKRFELDTLLRNTGLYNDIHNAKSLKEQICETGPNHKMVAIVKRQLFFRSVAPLIESNIQKHDPLWYKKSVNTAEPADRLYEAEEKLLIACLCIATAQPAKTVTADHYKPSLKSLRNMKPTERSRQLWSLLQKSTGETIRLYQQERKDQQEQPTDHKPSKKTSASGGWLHSIRKVVTDAFK